MDLSDNDLFINTYFATNRPQYLEHILSHSNELHWNFEDIDQEIINIFGYDDDSMLVYRVLIGKKLAGVICSKQKKCLLDMYKLLDNFDLNPTYSFNSYGVWVLAFSRQKLPELKSPPDLSYGNTAKECSRFYSYKIPKQWGCMVCPECEETIKI